MIGEFSTFSPTNRINHEKQELYRNFWADMHDSENGMGIKIHSSPHYEIPTINSDSLKNYFPNDKIESAKKYLSILTSYLNDKLIIEDKFSKFPPETQNQEREAKKKEFYTKYGELFTQNYEEKNKLRSIQFTNLCGSLQLLSLYSNNSEIKEAASSTSNEILTLVNGSEQNIISKSSTAQNSYNNYNLDQKIETIHSTENLISNFINKLSNPNKNP